MCREWGTTRVIDSLEKEGIVGGIEAKRDRCRQHATRIPHLASTEKRECSGET